MFGGGGPATSSNLRKICDPPKFDPSNLDRGKREMHFWRSMYQIIPDDQIVAAAGLQGNPELKEIVMDFTEENRAVSKLPTFENLLLRIDREYGALSEVQRMDRLQPLMQFKRDQSWDIRRFGVTSGESRITRWKPESLSLMISCFRSYLLRYR